MGAKVTEARPWENQNTDGSLNVGSYEVAAAVSATDLSWDLLTGSQPGWAATIELADPNFWIHVNDLAAVLLDAADRAQAAARTDGRSNRGDTSHARARGAVRTVLAAHPAPDVTDSDALKAWGDALGDTAARLLVTATGLIDGDHAARCTRREWPNVAAAKQQLLAAVVAAHPDIDLPTNTAAAAELWADAGLPEDGPVDRSALDAVLGLAAA